MADDSFDAFCRAELPRLVASLDLYCGDLGVAEDLAQEALIRVYGRWRRVRRMQSPGGFAHRVAMNLDTIVELQEDTTPPESHDCGEGACEVEQEPE